MDCSKDRISETMSDYVFFLGAGASKPFGIPTMTEMVDDFEAKTKEPHYGLGYVVQEIKHRLRDYQTFDIEALITVLQDVANYSTVSEAIFKHPSLHFFTPTDYRTFVSSVETLGKQYHNEANQILADVKDFVVESCNLMYKPFEIYLELFSNAMKENNYRRSVDKGRPDIRNCIFMTNYDLALEAYCTHFGINYENGETPRGRVLNIGTSNPGLYQRGQNAHQIYKLHGSINWYADQSNIMRWSSEPVKTGRTLALGQQVEKSLLIYPAFAKYTFREPFYAMFHHLKQCLVTCKACYVVGYSFRDEDILGLFRDAMTLNKHLRLVVVDPMAEIITREKFSDYEDRVHRVCETFTIEAIEQLAQSKT